jgi:hypothetical protein
VMKKLVMIAAAVEIPTALILILAPSVFTRLLFAADISDAGKALAPLAGFALFALAIASWPSRGASVPATSAVRALLVFSLLCTVYLAYRGVVGANTGPLLWPAAAGHAVLTLGLLWCWLTSRQRSAAS